MTWRAPDVLAGGSKALANTSVTALEQASEPFDEYLAQLPSHPESAAVLDILAWFMATHDGPRIRHIKEPAHEHELVRLRHVEGLTVHLLFELYVLPESFRYGMSWRDNPESLDVVVPPLEVAARAHKLLEDLREVS